MGALLGLFSTPARLQGLIIAAGALLVVALGLTTWALLERSGRLSLEVEAVTLRAQSQVLADALGRCNDGVRDLAKAGDTAVEETRRLVGIAEKALAGTKALREDIKTIVSRPSPKRADGKPKDCSDAMKEIRARVQP